MSRNLSEDEFMVEFTLQIEAPVEFAVAKDHNPRNVWTLVDGDDGGIYALPGFHVVNAIGSYLVTYEKWTDDIEDAEWCPASDLGGDDA